MALSHVYAPSSENAVTSYQIHRLPSRCLQLASADLCCSSAWTCCLRGCILLHCVAGLPACVLFGPSLSLPVLCAALNYLTNGRWSNVCVCCRAVLVFLLLPAILLPSAIKILLLLSQPPIAFFCASNEVAV